MKAAWYTRTGAAREVLQHGDLDNPPDPKAGEVLVKLHASGVNPSDWKVRKGGYGRPLIGPLIIPHSDGAGMIEAVGPEVTSRAGERVWIWNGQWLRPFGTAAQYIVLPENQAVHLPDNVTYVEGACLGIPAMTAMQAVYLAHVRKDSTVLVSGGAGSVGHYAIQLAKHRGGRVLSTVSNESKATHALQAGADEVINYRTENVASRVRQITKGRGADALIEVDLSGNAALYPSILAPHATVVVYGMSTNIANIPSLWMMQKSITLRLFLIYDIDATDRQQNIAHLHDCLTGRKLIHTVAKRLRLEEIAEAHDMVERGDIIGNIVLDIPEDS
jgi:NADPH:quinone reductase